MNLPNKITLLRIILIPLMLIFLLPLPFAFAEPWNIFISKFGMIIALIIFSIASYTDHLDGAIARKNNIVTNLGRFMDPIADKLLIISTFTALVELGKVTAWVPLIILFRELAVTGIRLLAIEKGTVIAAGKLGKYKMVSQIVAIIVLMIACILEIWVKDTGLVGIVFYISNALVLFAVFMTLWSGLDYIVKNRNLLTE